MIHEKQHFLQVKNKTNKNKSEQLLVGKILTKTLRTGLTIFLIKKKCQKSVSHLLFHDVDYTFTFRKYLTGIINTGFQIN